MRMRRGWTHLAYSQQQIDGGDHGTEIYLWKNIFQIQSEWES